MVSTYTSLIKFKEDGYLKKLKTIKFLCHEKIEEIEQINEAGLALIL